MLALGQAGIGPGAALAYSMVAQGSAFCFLGLQGLLAALWPGGR
jgi:hypothetical protein